jgi:hypothetical protein
MISVKFILTNLNNTKELLLTKRYGMPIENTMDAIEGKCYLITKVIKSKDTSIITVYANEREQKNEIELYSNV